VLVAAPAGASASTLFVGARVAPPGNSCGNAGYSSVQAAIVAASSGSTIEICGGTHREQLEIEKPLTIVGKSSPTILLPESPVNSETVCDHERNAARGGEEQDLVAICTAGTVTISKVIFEAKWPEGTCDDSLYGILVAGGATLDATKITVDGAGAYPIDGCQGGVGIQVGSNAASQVGHATLTSDTIDHYQKNGITVDGPGSNLTVSKATITGAGPFAQGQNGIQVSRGADANISKATISHDQCNISHVCGHESSLEWEEDAAGVLFYEPGSSSTVSSSTLSENNIGIEYVSSSPTLPASPEVSIVSNKISGGYASVQLNQGNAVLDNDKLSGALIGIDVNSYFEEDNSYAPVASVSGGRIAGSEAALKVESDLGSLPGKLSFVGSRIAGLIVKEDPEFEVTS
jgi:Right handed beta helix region